MINLYQHGSGSSECQLIKPVASPESLAKIYASALRLIRAKGYEKAAELFEQNRFELFEATNGFSDEFYALAKRAEVGTYADYCEKSGDADFGNACRDMAGSFSELGFPVRFVVVELDTENEVAPVSNPLAAAPVEIVKRALRDAEQLLLTNGAVSAIDRVHTALHGYLKWVCEQTGNVPMSSDPSITEFYKHAQKHPSLCTPTLHSDKIEKILKAFAIAIDAINQVRNRGSMAHANDHLLDDADAMLVINAVRTILRYFDDRLK